MTQLDLQTTVTWSWQLRKFFLSLWRLTS